MNSISKSIVVVIDGAYVEYVQKDDYDKGFSLTDEYENIILTRTFSKTYGLAALRVGWCYTSQKIADIEETHQHSIKDILQESLEHELHALSLYNELLEEVENKSVFLEEFARDKIGQEEQHSLELKKMLKDYS